MSAAWSQWRAPGPEDVLLNVAYSGVNPVDMNAAQGQVAADAPVPRALGTEGAGMAGGRPVMARGYGIGTARDGLGATTAVVPRAALIDVSAGIGLAAAAAMGVAGVTAWRTVTEIAQVSKDDTVLVLGASGGVDGLGDGFTGAAIEALEPHGRLVLSGASADPDGRVPLRALYSKGISVSGYAGLLESDETMRTATTRAPQAL